MEITEQENNQFYAYSLYQQASQFYEACELLKKELDQSKYHSHVIYADAFFGIELGLKSILFCLDINPPKTHNIKSLWYLLPESLRKKIINSIRSEEERRVVDMVCGLPSDVYNLVRYNEACANIEQPHLINLMKVLLGILETMLDDNLFFKDLGPWHE